MLQVIGVDVGQVSWWERQSKCVESPTQPGNTRGRRAEGAQKRNKLN